MARGPEDYSQSGTINAVGGTAAIALGFGHSVVSLQVSGSFSATLIPEVSYDMGATWIGASLIASNFTQTSGITSGGNFIIPAGGVTNIRLRCSAYWSGTVNVLFNASTANTNFSGVIGNTFTATIGGTSPSSATSVVNSTLFGLDCFTKVIVVARLQGATGGTLDAILQSSPDGGVTWYDVCHFTQLAAAASPISYFVSITRGETYSTTTPVQINTLNTAAGAGTLPAGQVIPHGLGNAFRCVLTGGAGTTAGTTQSVFCLFSTA